MNKQIALVTGASSGIGKALVKELIQQKWIVIGLARSSDKLNELQQEWGDQFIPLPCDVSNKLAIEKSCNYLIENRLLPKLLFLNAGIAGESALENPQAFDTSVHEKIMNVNYFGVLHWLECLEKPCQANGGATFIVTGSVNAIFAPPLGSAYAASKAAIAKAFEGLALTYVHTNLQFCVIYCGPVATSGLKGKLPFICTPEKMAKHMLRCALANKTKSEPSLFYALLTRLLCLLPYSWTARLIKYGN